MYCNKSLNEVFLMFDSVKRIVYKPILNRKQKKVNKLMEQEGYSDEVLEKQVEINIKRNELDLIDKSEIVNDEGYVQ